MRDAQARIVPRNRARQSANIFSRIADEIREFVCQNYSLFFLAARAYIPATTFVSAMKFQFAWSGDELKNKLRARS